MKYELPVFVFPNLVLFPSTVVSIQMFDSSSINILADCADKNIPVIMGLGTRVAVMEGSVRTEFLRPKEILTLGELTLLERTSNSILVMVKAKERVVVESYIQKTPILIAKAQTFPIKEISLDGYQKILSLLRFFLENWNNSYYENQKFEDDFLENLNSPEYVINYASSLFVKDIATKQMLLESRDLIEQVNILESILFHSSNSCKINMYNEARILQFDSDDDLKVA